MHFYLPFIFVFLSMFSFPYVSHAQTVSPDAVAQREAQLRAEYEAVQLEIAKWQQTLQSKQRESVSLERDIAILNAEITSAQLKIKAQNIRIRQLGKDISVKNATIQTLSERIERGRESLAVLMRKTNELDSYSLVEIALAGKDLSEFLGDFDSFQSVNRSLQELFEEIRATKEENETQKDVLQKRKDQETDIKVSVETEKRVVEKKEGEKKGLLSINKNQEKAYQTILNEREKRAAEIRAVLFTLRDSEGIPFGEALEYANFASGKTGIRSALILAILTQESDLGKNQGSCILSSLENGDGVGKNTGSAFEKIMKAPRDTEPFRDITSRLGRDWRITPVSCPPEARWSSSRGYGGGMGPSQFIPSTWELFKERVGVALSVSGNIANPWDPRHSFIATAIYLKDLGAGAGGYTAERNAACRYYSGRSCDNRRPANTFYGNEVVVKAQNIQENMIDPLLNL
ncbi:MAG: hypothetical protein AAB587_01530 [Patescibacteria group bacterium]